MLLGQASLLALAVSVVSAFASITDEHVRMPYTGRSALYTGQRVFQGPKKRCGEARSYGLTTITKVFLRFAIAVPVFLLMCGMSGALRSSKPIAALAPKTIVPGSSE